MFDHPRCSPLLRDARTATRRSCAATDAKCVADLRPRTAASRHALGRRLGSGSPPGCASGGRHGAGAAVVDRLQRRVTLRIMDCSRAYTRRSSTSISIGLADDDRGLRRPAAAARRRARRRLATLDALVDETSGTASQSAGRCRPASRMRWRGSSPDSRAARRDGRRTTPRFADALTVVYRILFLLFAEARGLVPQWHPDLPRQLHDRVAAAASRKRDGPPAGLWQSLQAIARLAHRGCTAGTLRVVPFNGRLFAPAAAPLADRSGSTTASRATCCWRSRRGRGRTGGSASPTATSASSSSARSTSASSTTPAGAASAVRRKRRRGTFYTPRPMTEYLVRRTLAPLVRGRTPEAHPGPARARSRHGQRRVPGRGVPLPRRCLRGRADRGGHACRARHHAADRAAFRRVVAQRCLYGVDVNPTAVQLARLSLWLCTLAADRPLTFLDHHLRAGNSLAGRASPTSRGSRRAAGGAARGGPLPLFDAGDLRARARVDGRRPRRTGARSRTTPPAIVRAKERTIEELGRPDGRLRLACRRRRVVRGVVLARRTRAPSTSRAWPAFSGALRGAASGLPTALERQWRATAAAAAGASGSSTGSWSFPRSSSSGGEPRARRASTRSSAIRRGRPRASSPPSAASRAATAAGARPRQPLSALRRAHAAADGAAAASGC